MQKRSPNHTCSTWKNLADLHIFCGVYRLRGLLVLVRYSLAMRTTEAMTDDAVCLCVHLSVYTNILRRI